VAGDRAEKPQVRRIERGARGLVVDVEHAAHAPLVQQGRAQTRVRVIALMVAAAEAGVELDVGHEQRLARGGHVARDALAEPHARLADHRLGQADGVDDAQRPVGLDQQHGGDLRAEVHQRAAHQPLQNLVAGEGGGEVLRGGEEDLELRVAAAQLGDLVARGPVAAHGGPSHLGPHRLARTPA
jgi:hypothetical protein